MKLLHLYNLHRFRGGADRAALTTVDLLRARGDDVAVMASDSQDLGPGLRGKVAAFVGGIYARDSLRRFDALLDSVQPEVVHAHKLHPLISPWALRVAHRRGIPVVMSVYDYLLTCPVATHVRNGALCTRCVDSAGHWGVIHNCRGRIAESVAYSLRHAIARHFRIYRDCVTRFVTPTRFSARWIVEKAGIPPERVRTIPLPFALPEAAADPAAGTYLAYVGRLAPEKGIATLIDAARRTGLPVRLAGDGTVLPMADALPNVKLVATATRAELLAFYRGARALVVPSVWFETFPLVIGEAMSHGIPVIASRIGGLPEMVREGATGLLVEPGDAEDLARKITRLWEDPGLARRLGAGARDFIASECGEAMFVDRLRAVYAEISR